ncbi:MAG TPA: hypothetical protein VK590_01340, partial [Saprospiraceae bacterium]|nr:hypothetical protein [Saprospiraceae bacterium]
MRLVFLFTSLMVSFISYGQIEKIIHQDFNIDRITTVDFALSRDYTLEKWAGTTILVETKVKMESASPSVLKLAIEQGRYEILSIEGDNKITLKSKIEKPALFRINNNDVIEMVEVKIMVPDEFNIENKAS